MSSPLLEDIPDEIILKVLGYLEIKDQLSVGHASKRLRAVSQDETLWKRISISWNDGIPAEFLDMVLQNGCRYLDLRFATLDGDLSPETKLKLKYLAIRSEIQNERFDDFRDFIDFRDSGDSEDPEDFKDRLLKSCNSLQKLQINDIDKHLVNSICYQHGKTLQALDISFRYYIKPEFFQLIARNCVELKELAFEYYSVEPVDEELEELYRPILCFEFIGYVVENLTTKIEKLCISRAAIDDEQVKTLVSRCKKLKVLDISYPYGTHNCDMTITDNTLTHIIEHLKPTLEELNVKGCEYLSYDKLVQLRSMPCLRKVNCNMWNNRIDVQELLKEMPHVEFSKEYGYNNICNFCEFRQWTTDRKRIWELSPKSVELFSKVTK